MAKEGNKKRILEGIPPGKLDPMLRRIFPFGVLKAWIEPGVSEQDPVNRVFEEKCNLANS